jgi:hypothetical protein
LMKIMILNKMVPTTSKESITVAIIIHLLQPPEAHIHP